jgi:hypothetical protein
MTTIAMTTDLGSALAALLDFAADNPDTAFTPADAGVKRATADALADAGWIELDSEGCVELSEAAPRIAPDRRSERRTHSDSTKITIVATTNPKRGKSAERFALYDTSPTVGEYIAHCEKIGHSRAKALADVRWDESHGFITTSNE